MQSGNKETADVSRGYPSPNWSILGNHHQQPKFAPCMQALHDLETIILSAPKQ